MLFCVLLSLGSLIINKSVRGETTFELGLKPASISILFSPGERTKLSVVPLRKSISLSLVWSVPAPFGDGIKPPGLANLIL